MPPELGMAPALHSLPLPLRAPQTPLDAPRAQPCSAKAGWRAGEAGGGACSAAGGIRHRQRGAVGALPPARLTSPHP